MGCCRKPVLTGTRRGSGSADPGKSFHDPWMAAPQCCRGPGMEEEAACGVFHGARQAVLRGAPGEPRKLGEV